MWQRWKDWFHRVWVDRPLSPGTSLASYQIKSVLGLGSYGIAYLAIHLPTGGHYVIKQVKPSLRSRPKGEALQQYEWKVLRSLEHPRIPRAVEHFIWRKHSFLVMTYFPGPTLEELLFDRHAAFSERDAVLLMREISEIVVHLHARGIVHRDVRIPNVIIHEGKPVLVDFGLARFLGDAPTYVSDEITAYPEEKQLKRRVAPSSDLYACGHFLLFLLYSTYKTDEGKPERSWEDELHLSPQVHRMIRKLLLIDPPYLNVGQWQSEMDQYLHMAKSSSTTSS